MNALPTVYFYDQGVEASDFTDEIVEGLSKTQKTLSPKFFYDEKGSQLFTEITRQPEYYPTRTETQLLRDHASEISQLIGEDFLLIEYGSGSSEKIRILLDSLRPSLYAPLDISRDYLVQAAEALGREYPWLEVHATCVDFTVDFELPFESEKRHVSFFPGSSIGNFERSDAMEFLSRIRSLVGADGGLLIGVDMKKDIKVLNEAYNDKSGVTADFNLNILEHINREYGANFDLGRFRHEATYDVAQGCIQMFLVSTCDQSVSVAGHNFQFSDGEKVHTENSHKYTVDEVLGMAVGAGFSRAKTWLDEDELFGVFYLYSE